MSLYAITEHHHIHTCPADSQRHTFTTTRTIVHTTPGRPCQTPVTIRVGDTTATIPCGRHNPTHRQCGACRTVVTTQAITATDHGHYQPTPAPTPLTHRADHPCPACGLPTAAILDRHLFCPPVTSRARSAA